MTRQEQLQDKRGRQHFASTTILLSFGSILFAVVLYNLFQLHSNVMLPITILSTVDRHDNLLVGRPCQSFSLAFDESLGFFDDISDSDWRRMKSNSQLVHHPKSRHEDPRNATSFLPSTFYQTFYEPDFSCRHEQRIGKQGDGGKWVCDPHRIGGATTDCLVYSIGSEGDFSFEMGVRDSIENCEIHTFDFGNYSSEANSLNVTHYHQWGLFKIGYTDGRGNTYKTLEQTVRELGHVGRTIDVFKVDCEGCEWSTAKTWMEAGVHLRQILVELHQVNVPGTMDFFDLMYENNYVIFHKEPNIQYWNYGGGAIEYSFLKLTENYRQH